MKKPEKNSNIVELWSSSRLPFEPKGWQLDMRDSLKSALSSMIVDDGSIFRATYTSEQVDFCDVENILIYNVGPGVFNRFCQNGIAIERIIGPVPQPSLKLSGDVLHHHLYCNDNEQVQNSQWKKVTDLVSWANVACQPLNSSIKPHNIWYSIKKGSIQTTSPGFYNTNQYGISVEINKPYNAKISLAGIMKPLLDGIISAFHFHEGTDITDVSERLANKLGTDKNDIQKMLLDKQVAALGPRKLIHPFMNGFQWNPVDDLFMQIEVVINKSKSIDAWALTGRIYELKQAY